MADWPLIGIRFALYADLMLLFGLPLFAFYSPGGAASAGGRRGVVVALSAVGLILSMLSITAMTAAMAGVAIADIDFAGVRIMVVDTAMGKAWVVRVAALVLMLVFTLIRPRAVATVLLAAVALASLAWTGHGAAGEGNAGIVQLAGDIVHLLASAAWVGALAALAALLFGRPGISAAQRALESFSRAGTAIVALVVASGIANAAYLVGWNKLTDLPGTAYGRLLIAKLLLFAAMLGFAALNRFRLTPALAQNPSLSALRKSLALESGAALAILALVAWLGTLEPPLSM